MAISPAVVDRVHLTYRRILPHTLEQAYAWLTDYDDGDADRAGDIIVERRVVDRSEDRVHLEGALEAFGQMRRGRAEVALDPPDHWTAFLYDAKDRLGDVYDYRLEPRNDGQACELIVDYGFVAPKWTIKLQLWLGRPVIRWRLDRMWDGFVQAMARELARGGDGKKMNTVEA